MTRNRALLKTKVPPWFYVWMRRSRRNLSMMWFFREPKAALQSHRPKEPFIVECIYTALMQQQKKTQAMKLIQQAKREKRKVPDF